MFCALSWVGTRWKYPNVGDFENAIGVHVKDCGKSAFELITLHLVS